MALRAGVRRGPARRWLAFWATLAWAACGGSGGGPVADAERGAEGPEAAGDGVSGTGVHRVVLVNPRSYPVVVFASAGAQEVLLDTVSAGDTTLLDLQVDAERLRLRAEDLDGNEIQVGSLSLGDSATASPGTPARWVIPPPPGGAAN